MPSAKDKLRPFSLSLLEEGSYHSALLGLSHPCLWWLPDQPAFSNRHIPQVCDAYNSQNSVVSTLNTPEIPIFISIVHILMNDSAFSRSDPNQAERESLPGRVGVEKLVWLECRIDLSSPAYLASLDIIIMADGRQAKRFGPQVWHDPLASGRAEKRGSTSGEESGSAEDCSVDVRL